MTRQVESIEWISVDELLPDSDLTVLVSAPGADDPIWLGLRDQRDRLLALANRAISVCQRHIVPDGISADTAMNELIGIFDGPEQRAAFTDAFPSIKAEPAKGAEQ